MGLIDVGSAQQFGTTKNFETLIIDIESLKKVFFFARAGRSRTLLAFIGHGLALIAKVRLFDLLIVIKLDRMIDLVKNLFDRVLVLDV